MAFGACLLLLAGCCLGALGQTPRQKKIPPGEDLHFQTKGKDACSMRVSDQGEIRLRLECRNQARASWCEYSGKPGLCGAFVSNPTLYWSQVVLGLRRLSEPCLAAPVLKPPLCQGAGPEAQLRQEASSLKGTPSLKGPPLSSQQSEDSRPSKVGPRPEGPAQKDSKEAQVGKRSAKKVVRAKPTGPAAGKPTPPGQQARREEEALRIAKEYCWEPLHKICSYIIGIFLG
ncbi:fibroblast growth factor-binding protein 2 [Antechinus flavipes]|uniref:fibroblast growth factor-binding protein 2 n=1 Tax=Antechinus flavipes TaxID=38775 RepID=UPI0022356F6A|nr:fibroblast growth factor-binding protein 2 [Antechinus flavipes]